MDSASENEDLTAQFLHQHHQGEQYLLSGGSVDGDTEGKIKIKEPYQSLDD